MCLLRRLLVGLLVVASLLVPARSEASDVRLGLGGHYWTYYNGAVFDLNLGVATPVAGPLSLGGRFGVLLATGSNTVGLPVDIFLRVRLGQTALYLEGAAGPWIFLSGDAFRAHGSFGFGLETGGVTVGAELGWLGSSPIAGLRLGLRL